MIFCCFTALKSYRCEKIIKKGKGDAYLEHVSCRIPLLLIQVIATCLFLIVRLESQDVHLVGQVIIILAHADQGTDRGGVLAIVYSG